jgi:hypothetical protein
MSDSEETIKKVGDAAKEMERQVSNAEAALSSLFATSLTGGKSFEGTVKSLDYMAAAAKDASKTIGALGSHIPFIGSGLSKAFDKLGTIFETTFKSLGAVGGAITSFVGGIDAMTETVRAAENATFGLAAGFGQGYTEARRFSTYVLEQAEKLATADYGYISLQETLEATKAMGDAGIAYDSLRGHVDIAGRSMETYAASILHARGLGMETSEYVNLLSNAIMRQGMAADEAMLQMAEFGDISLETGLSVKSIADNLQGLSNQFNKLGMSAEFGRPLLEGFTSTLSGMGLGIENALDLSTELSSSLAKLATDYSAAYVTFQRGGLDIGTGGGALGASIGLQAKMLEIKKAGGDQGQLAMEMTTAMKDTIASFTGGQIITVQEAAQDPGLQAQFYAQTELLGSLYDIQDPETAVRTLDLMADMENAIRMGDESSAQKLAQQIDDARKNTDQTISELQKLNTISEANKALLMTQNITALASLDMLAGIAAGVGVGFEKQVMENLAGTVGSFTENVGNAISAASGVKDIESAAAATEKMDFSKIGDAFADAVGSVIGDGKGGRQDPTPFDPVISKIDRLIDDGLIPLTKQVEMFIKKRKGKNPIP